MMVLILRQKRKGPMGREMDAVSMFGSREARAAVEDSLRRERLFMINFYLL
jgi:hypothetical protein